MKKIFKMMTTLALAFAMVMQVKMVPVQAASNVTIHVKNNIGWANVNIYTWGDDGEKAKAWPGTAMKDEGNGWLTYTFEGVSHDLNLVFNVTDAAGKVTAQTADIKGVKVDKSEYWVTIEPDDGKANDLGAATGGKATISDQKPADATPTPAPADDTKKSDNGENATTKAAADTNKQENQTTKAADNSKTTQAANKTAPKTGDMLPMATIGLMVAAGVALSVAGKKSKEY